jgi:hypothetical protein
MYYNRYKKDTGQYWGTTDRPGDDPSCEYLLDSEYPVPGYNDYDEVLFWEEGQWVTRPIIIEE